MFTKKPKNGMMKSTPGDRANPVVRQISWGVATALKTCVPMKYSR